MTELPFISCYASCSIGIGSSLPLLDKLKALAEAGWQGIELSLPDLVDYAQQNASSNIGERDYDNLAEAAGRLRADCDKLNLEIFMLQPFNNFEGWKKDSKERKDAFERANGWIKIMKAANIKLLQIGSSDAENISHDPQDMADDLCELADMLTKDDLAIAYENWCWATRAPSWEAVWEIVKIADRPNIGLCLDTFQTAGSLWADPTKPNGITKGNQGQDEFQANFIENLQNLARTVPKDKIFIFQISDAYKMTPPLPEKDSEGTPARSVWSHDHRPFPYNDGYLPVTQLAKAVFDTGFRGLVSMEVFDSREKDKYGEDLLNVAKSGMDSMAKLSKECGLQ